VLLTTGLVVAAYVIDLILGTMAVPMGSTFAKAQYMYQPVTRQDKNFQSWKQ
jgi:hypothetical protein